MDLGSTSEKDAITADSLQEISAIELNDDIILLPIFYCKKCSEKLIPPVASVKDVGNVCENCKSDYDCSLIKQDTNLEMVMKKLVIPCPYHINGCRGKYNYFLISNHMTICKYRNYLCPWDQLEGCSWKGSLTTLMKHTTESHGNITTKTNYNSFKLDIDVLKTTEIIRLLYSKDNNLIYILHVKSDAEESKIQFVMYYIRNSEKKLNLLYTIKLVNNEHFKSVLCDTEFTRSFNQEQALTLDISSIKQSLDSNKPVLTVLIKVIYNNIYQEEFDLNLLTVFECPVCKNYMKPPILQCMLGHSICNNCRPKEQQCAECKGNFGDTRNYALEKLSNNIRFPCMYRRQGCHIVLSSPAIVKHEFECVLQSYTCPISNNCLWYFKHSELIDHFQFHKETEIIHSSYRLTYISLENKSVTYYMFVDDIIFCVYNKINMGSSLACWNVQLIAPKGNAYKFKYEIGVIDSTDMNRYFTWTETCQEANTKVPSYKEVSFSNIKITNTPSDEDKIFSQCIKIPFGIIKEFAKDNQFAYFCKITKKVCTRQKDKLCRLMLNKQPIPTDLCEQLGSSTNSADLPMFSSTPMNWQSSNDTIPKERKFMRRVR